MNILEYRALKEQMAQQSQQEQSQQTEETAQGGQQVQQAVENQQTPETNPTQQQQIESSTQQEQTQETKPDKFVIDGIGEVSLEELKEWRNGYMRNADYTRKTQELARQRQEIEQFLATQQKLVDGQQTSAVTGQGVAPSDPAAKKIAELENRVYDLLVDREVDQLQREFPDFDAREVIPIAQEKRLSLRDAYLINKAQKVIVGGATSNQQPPANSVANTTPQIDVEALTREILKRLEAERDSTATIITPNEANTTVVNNEPKLTPAELEFCRKRKIDPKEYAFWKNAKGKRG